MNKELKKTYKEAQNCLLDFGFVNKNNITGQLKAIFDIEDEDINKSGKLTDQLTYDVHYKDATLIIQIINYQFRIVDIIPYDDQI